MSHPTNQNTCDAFLGAAAQLNDEFEAGQKADPSVAEALLSSLSEGFNAQFKLGTDGNDFLFTGHGRFTYTNAGAGDDFIFGGRRTDAIFGGEGDDILFGFGGKDGLFGGTGDDIIFGGRGNDIAEGGAGDDLVRGGRGSDLIDGNDGEDHLLGGRGRDTIFGGEGDDALFGQRGRDELIGGEGDDTVFGGQGADRFLFDPSNPDLGHDVIADFELGVDTIVLSAADILASAPGIEAADGDPAFSPADVDADPRWTLSASDDGDLLVTHPGGTIELDGIGFDASLSFAALIDLGAVTVEA